MIPLVPTRDCTVCGESWDDACREFGTAIVNPCPGHNIIRRSPAAASLLPSSPFDPTRRKPQVKQLTLPSLEEVSEVTPLTSTYESVRPRNVNASHPPPLEPDGELSQVRSEVDDNSPMPPSPSSMNNFSRSVDISPPLPTTLPTTAPIPQKALPIPPGIFSPQLKPPLSPAQSMVSQAETPQAHKETRIPIDTLPDSVLNAKREKKSRFDEEWNFGGLTCSYKCIWNSIKGTFTKTGWLRTWYNSFGNKKYLSREEFEVSLNSYAELLRLLDFYIVQRETGQLQAKDLTAAAKKRRSKTTSYTTLSSPEQKERQDQYLEALLIGIAMLLRSCGSPTWRLDYQLTRVAEGLGLKGMTFIVFPAFIVATLPSDRSLGLGSKTLCFDTRSGYDMSKLTAADNLARSVAALATNTDSFENMVVPALANDVQKLVVAIANSPETLDQVFGFGYDQKLENRKARTSAPRMRMQAKLEDAATYMAMLTQHMGSKEAAVKQLKARVIELAHNGTGFFSFDIPRISKELDPHWDPDGKLEQFYELRRIAFLEISLEHALTELDAIEKAPPMFSKNMQVFFGGLSAGSAAGLFFKGGWWDVLLCFVLGSGIAFLSNYSNSKSFTRLFECIAAFIVGLCCVIGAILFPNQICYSGSSIASVINVVQGVSITMAVVELATKNMISGTSRMFYSLLLSVIIGIGTIAGAQLGLVLMPALGLSKSGLSIPTDCHQSQVEWWAWLVLLPVSCVAYCGMFGAGVKQMPSMIVAMWIAYGVSIGTEATGESVSNILSAFCVGVYSNLIQKFSPAFTPFVPIVAGLLILVPGSMAVKGFESMMRTQDSMNGLTITFRVLFTALTLGLGLFLSSLVITPHELLGRFRHKKHIRTLKALTI